MHDPRYYREQAERARRLADQAYQPHIAGALMNAAQEFDDIATDLENGAVEIRHPELMPQREC